MSRVRCVVSDFGGVLTSPLAHAFAAVQAQDGVPLEALGRAMADATVARGENPLFPLERGEMTEREFLTIVGQELTKHVGRPVEMSGFGERYFAELHPNTPMIEHLRALRDERGVRLALLTNNVREWEERWKAMIPGVEELFEVIVDSAFVGMRKPDPRIYHLTCERLRLEPRECAFLDDIELNVTAAREVGMHAVHFRDTDQAIADLEALLA